MMFQCVMEGCIPAHYTESFWLPDGAHSRLALATNGRERCYPSQRGVTGPELGHINLSAHQQKVNPSVKSSPSVTAMCACGIGNTRRAMCAAMQVCANENRWADTFYWFFQGFFFCFFLASIAFLHASRTLPEKTGPQESLFMIIYARTATHTDISIWGGRGKVHAECITATGKNAKKEKHAFGSSKRQIQTHTSSIIALTAAQAYQYVG